ncbi:MAG: NAD-dependent epimerase/dehydratase family protein [Bacteroidota bacterium]
MKLVGIIGGAGFIGSHITKKFLENGFNVRVSATDISKSEKYEHLKGLSNADRLEICPLNVENEFQLKEFVKGCNILIHGGTPFQLDIKDPKSELFDPTIQGTENFLNSIQGESAIEKVILIASVATYNTNFPMPPDSKTPDDTFDEGKSPFISKESHPYAQAKFMANQKVEEFIKTNTDLPFDIISFSPTSVMGKSLSLRQDSTSTGLQFLLKNKMAPNPYFQMLYDNDVEFAMVDVKDVAEAVFKATTKNGLHGKNYLLSSESWRISDISAMLNGENPSGNARIIYKSDSAKNELDMSFNPAIIPLTDFSK